MHRTLLLTVMFSSAVLAACDDPKPRLAEIRCNGEYGSEVGTRQLKGACNVDTEHHVFAQHACFHSSGSRGYTTSNDEATVEKECRARILDLAKEFCDKNPDENNWQGSWTAFKLDGSPLVGSDMMFGFCKPAPVVERDEWAGNVRRF